MANSDGTYSDNFMHLLPGRTARVLFTPARRMTRREVAGKLRVHSLWNTYTTRA